MATQKEKAAELRWEALHLLNMALAFPEDSVHDGELEKTFAKVELKLGTSRKLMAEAISSGSKDGRATSRTCSSSRPKRTLTKSCTRGRT